MNNNVNNQGRSRFSNFNDSKKSPPLSLKLHTMPKTTDSHFRKWLLLGLVAMLLMLIAAYFLLG